MLLIWLWVRTLSRDERLWAHHRRPGHHHLHPRHPRGIRLRQVHLRCHRTLLDQEHEQKPCLMMISAFSNSSKCLSMFSIIIILFLCFCLFYYITWCPSCTRGKCCWRVACSHSYLHLSSAAMNDCGHLTDISSIITCINDILGASDCVKCICDVTGLC